MIVFVLEVTPLQIYFVNAIDYNNSNANIGITNAVFIWQEDGIRLIHVLFDRVFTGKIKFKILYI